MALVASIAATMLPAYADPPLPSMSLTVTGVNGNTQVFNQNEIAAMPQMVGLGGYTGNPPVMFTYTGVNVTYLASLVGGVTSHSTIRLISGTDGYTLDLNYADDGSIYCVSNHMGITTLAPGNTIILAYYNNSGDGNQLIANGPLRSAVIGPPSDSWLWNKNVNQVQVIDGQTALTISYSPSSVDITKAQTVTITGSLTTADAGPVETPPGQLPIAAGTGISGKTVAIYRSDATSGWVEIGQTTTQTNGAYSFNWTPDTAVANGNYQFKAVYSTDRDYFGSSAVTAGSGLFVLPEYTFGALFALAACFAAFMAYVAIKKNMPISQFSKHIRKTPTI